MNNKYRMNINNYLLINQKTQPFLNDHYYYIQDENNTSRYKKTVKFSNNNHYHIIPNRDFLRYHNLLQELWWKSDDYRLFRQQSMIEIITLSQRYPFINKKQLVKMLYQPINGGV